MAPSGVGCPPRLARLRGVCKKRQTEGENEKKKMGKPMMDSNTTHTLSHTKAIDEIKLLMLIGNRDLGEPT